MMLHCSVAHTSLGRQSTAEAFSLLPSTSRRPQASSQTQSPFDSADLCSPKACSQSTHWAADYVQISSDDQLQAL